MIAVSGRAQHQGPRKRRCFVMLASERLFWLQRRSGLSNLAWSCALLKPTEGLTESFSPVCTTQVAREKARWASSTIGTVTFFAFTVRKVDDMRSWYFRQYKQDEADCEKDAFLFVRFFQEDGGSQAR